MTILLAMAAAPAALAAEGDRVFDPELSLIGGCKAESLDPVEDPGCPTTPPPSEHPPSTFSDPRAVATDFYGNIYVSSFGANMSGSQGRIDIFCSDGTFITQLAVPKATSLAIDSQGYLYVYVPGSGVVRFAPEAPYDPEACEIDYGTTPVLVAESFASYTGLAINRDNDHLFANFGSEKVAEYTSAEEGNDLVRKTTAANWSGGAGMAVDAARDRMYASAGPSEERIDVFDLTSVVGTPPADEYEKIGAIDSSEVPGGDFGTQLSIAVDEGTGHVFVLDGENTKLYEFDETYKYVTTIDFPFQRVEAGEIGVDNGPFSPNKGYLFVPSHRLGTGHSFAFFESNVSAPEVISTEASNVSEDEAELQAVVNPRNLETVYTFEVEAEGSGTWTPVGEGTIPAGNLDVEVSAAASGLEPGTSYRFRIVATNEEGADEGEGSFATYPSFPVEGPVPCANALARTGLSAFLPDCRAYELVTPPDTNGRAPLGLGSISGSFTNRQVSPAGEKLPFRVEGGSIPGLGGTGSLQGDPYLSTRTPTGWTTAYIGPSGAEATVSIPGSASPDQGHSFWTAEISGSAVVGKSTSYVRYPDGHSELLGQGSVGQDPRALGRLISAGGGHIIFSTGSGASTDTAVRLEPKAAPDKTAAIYDRTPDGTTHVVSLKPGDLPFGAGEHAYYLGASLDGEGVAFSVGTTLYLRYDNEETFAIGTGVKLAGVAEGGRRVFYVEGGDLKRFEAGGGVKVFADAATEVVPVQASLDGTAAYFVSEAAIANSGPNPAGDQPQPGEQNLYLSEEGTIGFVGTVTERDVEGAVNSSGALVDGLGLWLNAFEPPLPGGLAAVPARTTPDGSVLLFKSRAALTDYDPNGKAQIYRFDSVGGELQCLSCNPTGTAASSDAGLQSDNREGSALFGSLAWLENLRADGRRAFFESSEPLVAHDSDGLQDVYEWEENGVGSCTTPGGCTYLISSPQSLRNEYLWAVSESGDDVFFLSSELLVGRDTDETPSIYDARVGGGFPEQVTPPCEGEGCRPQHAPVSQAPTVPTLAKTTNGNFKPKRCAKGKRRVKRAGKVRCVKKKKQRSKQRAGNKQRGGRR